MDNVFEKWNPNKEYSEGNVVLFADKLYIATYNNNGVLPIHRTVLKNPFNVVDNSNLIDKLISEYECKEDFPVKTNITFEGEPITFEGTPITYTDEELFNWRLI